MRMDKKKKKMILKILIITTIILYPLLIINQQTVSAVSSENEVPIAVYYNRNISVGVIYTAPLRIPPGSYNYYVINQYGTILYSYLFSTNPAFLVWYDPNPVSETYYFVYGQSVTSQLVSTKVFSLYNQFYTYNTSFWNITNGVVSGGVLTLNGHNSILTENLTAPRYSSALWLYDILSPESLLPSKISYNYPIPPGSLIIVHELNYSGSYQAPYSAITQYNSPVILAESYSSQYLSANTTYYSYNYNNVRYVGSMHQSLPFFTCVTSNGIIFNSIGGQRVVLNGAILPDTSYLTHNVFIAGELVGEGLNFYSFNASFIWCPELVVNGSIQLLNGSKVPITGKYAIDQATYGIIINSVFHSDYDELIAPVGSIVTITYSNGSTFTFIVSGSSIYSGFPIPIAEVSFYGIGVSGISISVSQTGSVISQQYSALVGFTDLLHKYGVLIKDGKIYPYIAGSVGAPIGNATFPMVVAVGEYPIGNTYYVFGEVVTETNTFTFIQQSPYQIASTGTIAYVNYNGSVPFVIPAVAETLSTGTYYELSGIAVVNVGQSVPINSVILTAISQPGLKVVNNGGSVYLENPGSSTNSSAPNLCLIGFQGYTITLTYGYTQQNLVATSNVFPVNIPPDLELVITINQATRSISITTGQTGIQNVYINNIPINTATTFSPPPTPMYNSNLITFSQTQLTIIGYYVIGALAIVSIAYGNRMWLGVFIFSISLTALIFVFQIYSLVPLLVFAIILGYMLKKMDY